MLVHAENIATLEVQQLPSCTSLTGHAIQSEHKIYPMNLLYEHSRFFHLLRLLCVPVDRTVELMITESASLYSSQHHECPLNLHTIMIDLYLNAHFYSYPLGYNHSKYRQFLDNVPTY